MRIKRVDFTENGCDWTLQFRNTERGRMVVLVDQQDNPVIAWFDYQLSSENEIRVAARQFYWHVNGYQGTNADVFTYGEMLAQVAGN